MAHPMNDAINRAEGREPVPCNETCKYWTFPNLDTACVLSPVFSVRKGEPCFEYVAREGGESGSLDEC